MGTRRKAAADPAAAANQAVLATRQAQIDKQLREIPDLGLNLQADNASAFLRDEWDKKAFGEEPKTVTRMVYGPDSLIDTCPEFKAAIEKNGLEAYAEATFKAILKFEHRAVPDQVMQRGLFAAIKKFGVKEVAKAFRDRILEIPAREVHYELDGEIGGDPLLLGSNALRDCVNRYGEPGKAYKFLSARCMEVLGMRGYTLVHDKKGDPVKAGTLFMGWIPQHVADARRIQFARESQEQVAEQQENFIGQAEKFVREAGAVGKGSRPLSLDEVIRPNASESEDLLGGEYAMGVRIEPQS